ncbi:MAG: succinyl-diaminopimelate desuccinylase [Hyphomicrobiales bacterium]|nr:succinyl-diaminopimelate desuccinylase [Hyphomicrobiales bacterium]
MSGAPDPADALAIARALLRAPSVTPDAGAALDLCETALKAAGFATHRLRFEAPGTAPVENLFAKAGAGRPHLLLAGHVDVVPVGDEAAWRHAPFGGELDGGDLYGRGACDMKGAVACLIAAAAGRLRDRGAPKGAISFLLTGDEEGPAVNGTAPALEWARAQGEVFDHCLLGEPTNPDALGDMMKIGRRGSLTGRLVVDGVQGHVAYPERALNPVPALMRLMRALDGRPLDEGSAHFVASNLEFVTVDVGNPAANVIPARARATFNVRFNDRWTAASLAAELRARAAGAGAGAPWTLTFDPSNAESFVTPAGGFAALVADAAQAETGRRPEASTTGGTSDARFLKDHCEVVEFGLVGASMHGVDERAAVADIETLARIYRRIIDAVVP